MNIELVKRLIQMGVIKANTEVDSYYMGVDLSGRPLSRTRGTFYIRGVRIMKSGIINFDVTSTVDGSQRTVVSTDVQAVDGMPLERLGGIYGINETGGTIAQGKRRGRRPRAKVVEAA